MAERPTDEGVLLVNLPAWSAPARTTFPVGVEYVTLMGQHLFAEELVNEAYDKRHTSEEVSEEILEIARDKTSELREEHGDTL